MTRAGPSGSVKGTARTRGHRQRPQRPAQGHILQKADRRVIPRIAGVAARSVSPGHRARRNSLPDQEVVLRLALDLGDLEPLRHPATTAPGLTVRPPVFRRQAFALGLLVARPRPRLAAWTGSPKRSRTLIPRSAALRSTSSLSALFSSSAFSRTLASAAAITLRSSPTPIPSSAATTLSAVGASSPAEPCRRDRDLVSADANGYLSRSTKSKPKIRDLRPLGSAWQGGRRAGAALVFARRSAAAP
jgi:hypothetical protein